MRSAAGSSSPDGQLLTLPYRQLVDGDAAADLSADRIDALAAAELARLGVAARRPKR
jgi:hypothetical protein